ncbi:hypothetical protein ACIGO9_08470 [Nocardia asteroides]|uniref:hypothetical protein n=1 Tax=Nocardia asteroides TaxID=1824 RepID=UPI0037CB90C8
MAAIVTNLEDPVNTRYSASKVPASILDQPADRYRIDMARRGKVSGHRRERILRVLGLPTRQRPTASRSGGTSRPSSSRPSSTHTAQAAGRELIQPPTEKSGASRQVDSHRISVVYQLT